MKYLQRNYPGLFIVGGITCLTVHFVGIYLNGAFEILVIAPSFIYIAIAHWVKIRTIRRSDYNGNFRVTNVTETTFDYETIPDDSKEEQPENGDFPKVTMFNPHKYSIGEEVILSGAETIGYKLALKDSFTLTIPPIIIYFLT